MLDVLLISVFSKVNEVKLGVLTIGGIPDFSTLNVAGLIFFAALIPFVAKLKKVHPIVFIAIGAVFGIVFKM